MCLMAHVWHAPLERGRVTPPFPCISKWQGRRDSNPQSWFWRPVVYQLTDAPIGISAPLAPPMALERCEGAPSPNKTLLITAQLPLPSLSREERENPCFPSPLGGRWPDGPDEGSESFPISFLCAGCASRRWNKTFSARAFSPADDPAHNGNCGCRIANKPT